LGGIVTGKKAACGRRFLVVGGENALKGVTAFSSNGDPRAAQAERAELPIEPLSFDHEHEHEHEHEASVSRDSV
jgi:hypothetical protein